MALALLVGPRMQRIALPFVSMMILFSLTSAHASPDATPVIGGKRVSPGDWPDVVAVLGRDGSCTGTLIAPDVVLTAGHCADIRPSVVIANTVDYAVAHAGERIAVKSTRAYPRWEDQYDVAVIVLEHVAKAKPRPIATGCLANRALGDGVPLTIVGFGLTSPRADDNNTALRAAQVPLLDATCTTDEMCNPAVQPSGEFAAGGRGTDTCFGDSGGPAMLTGPSGPVLVGVTSRGLGLPGLPCGNGGVYIRADKVAAWIERTTKRKLTRVGCGGPADDPEITAEADDESGGCSAGVGGSASGVLVGIAMLAGVWRRRATRGEASRPDERGPVVRAEAGAAAVEAGGRTASDARGPAIVAGRVGATGRDDRGRGHGAGDH